MESSELFERIRSQCREVTRRARFVAIDDDGISRLAARLANEAEAKGDLDPAHHYRGADEDVLAFLFVLDAINFGSGWFPVLHKADGLSGYRTIATACKEHFETRGSLSGEDLRSATADSMATLLHQDLRDPEVAELMRLFAASWCDLGIWLLEGFGDRFEAVIEHADHSAARLVESLAEMPLYRDVSRYEELDVPFFKRAQITVADLNRAFPTASEGRFDDLDRLTLFADNLVPHVLRCAGVLVYEKTLERRIEANELIEAGCLPEIEIRAVALEAVERLVECMRRLGRPTTAHELDARLWNAGQAPEIKASPRHRTRSPFY